VPLRRIFIVLIAIVAASSDLVAAQFSMDAMACCAKTQHECAGIRTPDDCCKGMGHGVGAAASLVPAARAGHVAVTLAILPGIEAAATVVATPVWSAPTFKRPHDPPHLHPVPLLI
jgi:hypothetical protein